MPTLVLFILSMVRTQFFLNRTVRRTLIDGKGGGGELYIHIFIFCSTSFFNQIQIDQFEKKSAGQNVNI